MEPISTREEVGFTIAGSGLAALMLMFFKAEAYAEHRLQPSDVLKLSVTGRRADTITIFDGNDPDKSGRIAGESDLLSPGDLVEVTLEPPWAAGAVDDATTGAVEPSGGNR